MQRLASLAVTINTNTPMGTVSIGGNAMPLTFNLLFTMVCEHQAMIDIFTEQSKNTDVIFDGKAFASETVFVLWFRSRNPSREGMAAWVDIISIWAFGTADHINSTQWLTELHRYRLEGLKGIMDIAYVHLMSTCYPTLFVGAAKDQILSTTTIKMFDSHDVWRGDGTGNGNKPSSTARTISRRGRCAPWCCGPPMWQTCFGSG
jgi:hypothetical protein